MSDQDKQEAREHLGRAGRQGRHAAKNVARAAQLGTEVAVDETKDALKHTVHAVENGAEHVVEEVKEVTPKLSARGLAVLSSDMGVGFFSTAVSIYAANIAYHSFRAAIQNRGRVVR